MKLVTFEISSRADSSNICIPRVAMTDANTTIPWHKFERLVHAILLSSVYVLRRLDFYSTGELVY